MLHPITVQIAGGIEFFIAGKIICSLSLRQLVYVGVFTFKVYCGAYNERPLQCILNTTSLRLHNKKHVLLATLIHTHIRISIIMYVTLTCFSSGSILHCLCCTPPSTAVKCPCCNPVLSTWYCRADCNSPPSTCIHILSYHWHSKAGHLIPSNQSTGYVIITLNFVFHC